VLREHQAERRGELREHVVGELAARIRGPLCGGPGDDGVEQELRSRGRAAGETPADRFDDGKASLDRERAELCALELVPGDEKVHRKVVVSVHAADERLQERPELLRAATPG
jgi:hypothetical protein